MVRRDLQSRKAMDVGSLVETERMVEGVVTKPNPIHAKIY